MTEEEKEAELMRKVERNQRAFEAWLERKKEAEKGKLELERKAAVERELERQERHRVTANLAYQRWLQHKHEQDQIKSKKRILQKQLDNIKAEERRAEKEHSLVMYNTWKTQKDLEMRLQRRNDNSRPLSPSTRAPTPMLPGYCSVWSCDDTLADVMVGKVDRGPYALSEVNEPNFTVNHEPTY